MANAPVTSSLRPGFEPQLIAKIGLGMTAPKRRIDNALSVGRDYTSFKRMDVSDA
jgi:hypothetical protein